MIPTLHEKDATTFDTLGLGALPSWIEDNVEVVEERNGEFYLQGELPRGGLHVDQLAVDRIILAAPAPGKPAQPFRIRNIEKPEDSETVKVLAQHVSYQLTENYLKPSSARYASANQMLDYLTRGGHMVPQIDTTLWTFQSDIVLSQPEQVDIEDPKSVRAFLGGSEGSMIDHYGGELEWDYWTVKLLASRGRVTNKVIRYGLNLESLAFATDVTGLVTGYLGWWRDSDGLYYTDAIMYKSNVSDFAYPRIEPVDLSQEITLTEGQTNPTTAQMEAALQAYMNTQEANHLSTSIVVNAVPEELQNVYLCDTVTVVHPGYALQQQAKVVETVYDPINERYKSITIGEIQQDITDTIAELIGGR